MQTAERSGEHKHIQVEEDFYTALVMVFDLLHERILAEAQKHGLSMWFWREQRQMLERVLKPLLQEAMLTGIGYEQAQLAQRGVRVGTPHQLEVRAVEMARALSIKLTATTEKSVNEVINQARQQTKAFDTRGLHYQLANEILSAPRAAMIAATETNRAMSAGQLLLWEQMGSSFQYATSVVGKRWRVSAGEKTCPICAPLDGKTARLREAFVGGIDQPPAHPRCRCTMELVWRENTLRKPAPQIVNDPCAHLTSYRDRVNCYTNELGGFGVSVSGAFTPEQLQAMVNAVNITANRVIEECGLGTTSEEVFYQVFGDVQFRYDPDPDKIYGVTDTRSVPGTAIIILPEGLFTAYADNKTLDTEFVIVHELGHVFQNYLGEFQQEDEIVVKVSGSGTAYDFRTNLPAGTPTVIADYLTQTGGYWTPLSRDYGGWRGGFTKVDMATILLTSANFPNHKDATMIPPYPVDLQGNRVSAENQYVYFREAGTYLAGTYAAPGIERYFPNEAGATDHASPMEGFADSFAVYVRLGADVPSKNESRMLLFKASFCKWANDLRGDE